MKRGEQAFLKRGKKRYSCEVLHDHSLDDPPFPAVTVKRGSDEWVVGINELVNPADLEREARDQFLQTKWVPEIIAAYESGAHSVREVADQLGVQMIDVLSKYRKAQRLGLIKVKSYEQN